MAEQTGVRVTMLQTSETGISLGMVISYNTPQSH